MQRKSILLTGATGLLGAQLLKIFLEKTDNIIYVLVRGQNRAELQKKTDVLFSFIFGGDLPAQYRRKILFVNGDITLKQVIVNAAELSSVLQNLDSIYHSAAATGFRLSLEETRRINLYGTENLISLASQCRKRIEFNHISTMFVAGSAKCAFDEMTGLESFKSFNNPYEQSKHEAEIFLGRKRTDKINVRIYRPSIVAGDFNLGRTNNFKMLYEPLHFFSRELFSEIPADGSCLHNVIPADVAAEMIYLLSTKCRNNYINHIISRNCIAFSEFMSYAQEYFKYDFPSFVPLENFRVESLTPVQKHLISPFLGYFNLKVVFRSSRTTQLLDGLSYAPPFIGPEYFKKLFEFCHVTGFLRRKK